MSCDENSFKHNRQTSSSEVRTKTVSFNHASKFDFRRLNQLWRTFLSSVVEAENSRCLWRRNLRVQPVQFYDGFLSSCETPSTWLSWLHDHAQLWRVWFTFKYPSMALCMILRDSSPLVSLFLFVTSAWNFILRTLSSSCGAVCFKIHFYRYRD